MAESNTPRTDAARNAYAAWKCGDISPEIPDGWGFARQLERELALKDADLLLERDRAEKAEKELVGANKRTIGWSEFVERAEKSEAQVKMLVEALEKHKKDNTLRGESIHTYPCGLCEALAKIKE